MLRKVEKNASSLDEAIALAAVELGVSKDEVSYEVTREVGKGLMKLLVGHEIYINAWITKEQEAEEKKAEKKAEKASEKTAEKKTVEKPVVKANTEKISKHEDKDIVIPKTAVDDAKSFIDELLTKMGIEHELYIKIDNNAINIEVSGEKMGLLIGKRGDTLDSVQYLTSLYVNRAKNSYIKVKVDTEDYRSKREETLIRLAKGLERSVMKDKKTITLEPMSPNERRIIHATIQNNPKVTTYSVGTEPNRKVVVAYGKQNSEEKTSK